MGPTSYSDPKLKKRLEALARIEGGLDGLNYDVETPMGQLNVSRAPLKASLDLENLPVAAPESSVGGMRPEELTMPPVFAAQRDDELEAASALDEEAMRQRLFETASRQLIGGLTRTAPQATLTQPTTKKPELLAQRAKARQEALREIELGNQAKRFDYEKTRDAEKLARDEDRYADTLKERDLDNKASAESRRLAAENNAIMRGIALQGAGIRKDEADAKKQEREEKATANTFPLAGGTFTIKKGLDDSAANKARSGGAMWNTALGNLESLEGSLSEYVKKPSLESKAKVEAQLQGAMTALNVAYGQGAMAESEARALSAALGADLKSPTAIAAAIQSWMGGDPAESGRLLMTKIRTVREGARNAALQSLSPYGEMQAQAAKAATSPDEDAQAIEWAKANRSNPKAAEILRLHGVK